MLHRSSEQFKKIDHTIAHTKSLYDPNRDRGRRPSSPPRMEEREESGLPTDDTPPTSAREARFGRAAEVKPLNFRLVEPHGIAATWDAAMQRFPPGMLFVDMRLAAEAYEGDEIWRQVSTLHEKKKA